MAKQRGEMGTDELSSVNKRLHEVVESTKKLLGSGELEQSGQIILEEFGRHMNAEGGSIYQVNEFGLKHLFSLDPGHAAPFLPFPLDDNSVFARALNSSEPYRVIDVSSEETLQSSGWQHYADNSMLFFSICDSSGKTSAIISLHSKKNPPFIAQDREIGALLASYAGEALQTAQAEAALKKSEVALMQAQKMEAIGSLAGGIAHDFNNILSAIIGYTDLSLFAGNLPPNIINNLEQVQKASNRARDLIKQILTFSRSGEFEEEAVDVSPIIKEALKLLRAVIPSSIEIRMDIPEGLGKVLTDPSRIHQVLMNLCSNAAQAMADNGEIAIKLCRIEKENYPSDLTEIKRDACVCLSVTDNGSGMDSDVVGRIFDPYFTTKQKTEGTGLGLAVVQGIVLQSEGAIRVLSRVGLGSTFILYLPVVEEQVEDRQLRQDFIMPKGTERILFVDDEEALAEVTQEMLQKLGYKVEIQTNSVEALHRFRSRPSDYDLLITDQTMPDLSGMELAREALDIRSDIPVVLYTGYSSSIDEYALRRIGIKKHLMKPLSMTKLATVIRQILDT